ncbi:alpha-2-macroglobulin family protein [Aminobacter sp. MET-1]|uniref:alpha-2-macroglobulin family protein n=1 Tax=Aminobacter sp. MET-1 TaxID=2951085 RepID=UPI00226AE669|nr:alpha-2-macroglobulin family protein [Aminobacter sp. MET-1]MCX8572675.1 alpha-2-macroglobulin family protein [Aminobacter sp. MET-1]
MMIRAARTFPLLVILLLAWTFGAMAQNRHVVTSDNGDYFGFDLRSEQNVTLDQCQTTCLGDQACRAFTYNTKAKWCFLKSDFAVLKPFAGAVAGKVVPISGDPDIGAPAELSFFPASMVEEARQFRNGLTANGVVNPDLGLAALTDAGETALQSNDGQTAMQKFRAAAIILPDDTAIWIRLARAVQIASPNNGDETATLPRDSTSTAYNAYLLSRTAADRAESLTLLARGLDKRDMFRPALRAYEASLALDNSASVRAEYEDLKARKGFRVVEHSIDADTSSPRVCAQFSEALVKTGVDYAPFVTVDDQAPKGIEAKDQQICVEGLEHGKHYRVTFRPGLPAAIGEVLTAPVVLSVYVQDRGQSARFTGDSFVLPSTARRGIPVVTVNMAVADMKLFRVGDRSLAQLLSGYQFLRQLDGYDLSNISDQMGTPVWEGQLDIANELNKEVTTSFPVDEALPNRKPGVYVLTAQAVDDKSDSWSSKATQWFVVSDIGLSTYTGEDGLNVFARSLATAKPIADTELTLLARNNEVLGTAKTDAEGRATFTAGLTRGDGGMAPAVLMASQGSDDFVFLDMTRAGFDLSDRGVAGRASPGALDVYAWTERGIYRVGETVHAAALARDDAARAADSLPLTFIFTRPDGVEDRRIVSQGGNAGGHAVDLALSSAAMRGTWTLSIYTDPKQPAVASQMFLVEDFVPDRIEFDLSTDRKEIAVGETAEATVDGRFLYGAPAAGLALEGELTLSTKRQWDSFAGYYFGLADEQEGEATRIPLDNLPVVGDDGKATFPVEVGQVPSTTRLVNAGLTVRMRETGGRAVEKKLDIGILPQGTMLGIRPDFSGGEVPQGGTAKFSLIAAQPDGKRTDLKGAQWSLVKVERNYQWYRSGNSWNYEPVTFTKSVASGQVDLTAAGEASISTPVDWGRYRLEVETADPAGPATSYEFDAGWYVSATSTETPDGLEVALDKATYKAGDVAKLKVSPRFAGELLVTIGAEKLLKTVSASIPAEGGTVDIAVGDDWGAGAYVTATLYRPGEAQESRMPARAIGLKWLAVDPADKKLNVALDLPEKTEPRKALSVPVTVTGAKAGDKAYVTVAAVDVGILNLTSYKVPDPENWYFGQRMMGLELRDLYGRLIDGSLGAMGKLRTGGDGAAMASQGSPPKEKLVAFFSGIVELDADGKTTVDFDIPQFNGTVRVMSVAWTKDAVGHATGDVIVRDPIVLTAGMPRFMAPGDFAEMTLDVANTDAPAGDYTLSVDTTGDLSTGDAALPQKLTLEPGKRQTLKIPLMPVTAGTAGLTVRIANAEGLSVEQELSLPVRPGQLPVTTRMVVDLKPNASLRIDRELLAASLLEGAHVSVGVSQSSAFDVPSMLMTLDRYPYGCAEQTTSRALPLLYVSELSADAGMADDPALRERIQGAIFRVLNYQSSSGSFGLWGPGSGDLWLDAYVTDFLTRAREKGFDVPQQAMMQALNNLQNAIGYDVDVEDRGSEIAYALYVLARNKKASVGDLRYFADTKLEAFSSPMAVAQLGASLALYGDTQRSENIFNAALQLAKATPDFNWYRSDYGSRLRDGAAMLALAAESKPVPSVVPALVKMVAADRASAKWTSTQDDAWMLLAARALKAGNEAISLDIGGTAHSGAYSQRIDGADLLVNPVSIANKGKNPVQAVVTTVAAPAQPLPAGGDGFTIERTYYRLDGSEANVTEVNQNERFVVVLKVTELNDWPSRIVVADMLPAGFEIDNPGLVNSASLSNFPWLEQTQAAHLEFRDDRFVAAMDSDGDSGREFTLAYVVRAVTPGTYAHPAANVEDMYRPQYSARTATGMMEVKAE